MNQPWTTAAWTVPFPVAVRVRADAGDPTRPLLVYLHGMGENASSFETFWPRVAALELQAVVPSGPFAFEKREDGQISIGHAWYLYDGGETLFRRTGELVESHLLDVITRTERTHGLAPSARALLGYSMGAYFGYLVALRNPGLFDYVVGVSGNLKESFVEDHLQAPLKPACLVVHGEQDRAVPPDFARRSHRVLTDHGYDATLKMLPGGHGIRGDRDKAVAEWLAHRLNLSGSSP